MVKIVLVGASSPHFHTFQCRHLGHDQRKQSASGQFDESQAGHGRKHNLVQLVHNAFLADNGNALGIAFQGLLRLVLDTHPQLGGETDATHHAQRVVAEGYIGVKGCGDDAVLHISQPIKTVYQFAKTIAVETNRQGIDGKVATAKVVLQGAVLHNGLAAVVTVTFLACAYKLHLYAAILDLCCSEIAEHTYMRPLAQTPSQSLGHADARAYHQTIDVLAGTLQKEVAHIASHHITLNAQFVCRLAYAVEDGAVKQFPHLVKGDFPHRLKSSCSLRLKNFAFTSRRSHSALSALARLSSAANSSTLSSSRIPCLRASMAVGKRLRSDMMVSLAAL